MTHDVQKISERSHSDERVIVPVADIYETENEYVITMDMPGVEKADVDILIDKNDLTIQGTTSADAIETEDLLYSEYQLYNYKRNFIVGNDIESGKVNAAMNNGVLEITLPKKDEVKPKKIEITID